ncbi:MAG: 4-alpha-glucanotransferase [Clostridiales bacterium]|jgi:4-alpha-glucanotransferase|nr:4-alpha-glucanotransferase [Clostridiales bacterium]
MFNRASGVLLNISSLPGDFGIGDFSDYAKEFAKNILDMGFHWWQILPLNPVGVYNSPYDSPSAFAGNYLYIDPYGLVADGLLTYDDVAPYIHKGQRDVVEYENVKFNKRQLLKHAFEKNLGEIGRLIADFERQNAYWLDDYVSYMALKSNYFNAPWFEWEDAIKFKRQPEYDGLLNGLSKYVLFFKFEQYLFWRQWGLLKAYVNSLGVNIMGDSPIYVSYDSADVYHNPKCFRLDGGLNMKKVAGVPPDYFAENGQLWNNPLYDFKAMKKDKYSWFKSRIKRLTEIYDAVRIDHFRGFYSYYSIDAGSKTAVDGVWEKGPGLSFFKEIKKQIPNAEIVAEDLGVTDDRVKAFLEKTGFPGMRVFEFGFAGNDSDHLPHNYIKNSVAYTGTHDNDTALGWLYGLNDNVREHVLRYCRYQGGEWGRGGLEGTSVKTIINVLLSSVSALAIIPVQDICGFGGDTRMNTPGVAENNWLFRLIKEYASGIDKAFFVEANNVYHRNNSVRKI